MAIMHNNNIKFVDLLKVYLGTHLKIRNIYHCEM